MSIRLRLTLLLLCIIVPAVGASVWGVASTYLREQATAERSLRETTRALALVIDRELGHREAVARTLAASPSIATGDVQAFHQQARDATADIGGWTLLYGPDGTLVDTRQPNARRPAADGAAAGTVFRALESGGFISGLTAGPRPDEPVVAVSVPSRRVAMPGYGVSIVMPVGILQRVVEELRLPAGWVAAVIDQNGVVVARRPDSAAWRGKPVTPAMMTSLQALPDGLFRTPTLDGSPARAFFSRSPSYGWSFVIAVPDAVFESTLRRSMRELGFAALALLALGLVAAAVGSRKVTAPAVRLQAAARALESGVPVDYQPSGVPELDRAGETLVVASRRLREANEILEKRVATAIRDTESAHEQLAAAQRLEALGRLTGGVAHDVNNLLAVVANNAVLLKRLPPGAPQDAPIAAMLRAVDTGRRLTQKLLSFAKRRASRPAVLDLCDWMPAALALIKTSVRGNVAVRLQVDADVAPVEVDPTDFELALLNLAVNASDAMPDGGLLAISVRGHDNGTAAGCVDIEVRDTGDGIPPESLARVFEPFFTTKDESRGSGLGLSQVYGFCQQSGGTVSIGSTPGQGTTVTMRLPASVRSRPMPQAAGDTDARPMRRLLYVEDNAELAEATRSVLATFGYRVEWAPTAERALLRLETERFDVVLSDVVMPGRISGVQLAERLRALYPTLPVVLVSGYTAEAERAAAAGFEVLQKPCMPDDLAGTLARIEAISRARA